MQSGNIQKQLDARFKETGVENVYLPMLIPESLLQKEKDYVEGFCTRSSMGNSWWKEKLAERLCDVLHQRTYSATM